MNFRGQIPSAALRRFCLLRGETTKIVHFSEPEKEYLIK